MSGLMLQKSQNSIKVAVKKCMHESKNAIANYILEREKQLKFQSVLFSCGFWGTGSVWTVICGAAERFFKKIKILSVFHGEITLGWNNIKVG